MGIRNVLFTIAIILCSSASVADDVVLSEQQLVDVVAVERYLNGLKTIRADFTQMTDSGKLTGKFYLFRPGRLRFQYDPPVNDFIVSDGRMIFYWDDTMEQQSQTGVGDSLADLILRENISFLGDVSVIDVYYPADMIAVTVVETEEPENGKLTLFFDRDPMVLKRWQVVDADGFVTDIGLFNVTTGLDLDHRLFYFSRPKKGRN